MCRSNTRPDGVSKLCDLKRVSNYVPRIVRRKESLNNTLPFCVVHRIRPQFQATFRWKSFTVGRVTPLTLSIPIFCLRFSVAQFPLIQLKSLPAKLQTQKKIYASNNLLQIHLSYHSLTHHLVCTFSIQYWPFYPPAYYHHLPMCAHRNCFSCWCKFRVLSFLSHTTVQSPSYKPWVLQRLTNAKGLLILRLYR